MDLTMHKNQSPHLQFLQHPTHHLQPPNQQHSLIRQKTNKEIHMKKEEVPVVLQC